MIRFGFAHGCARVWPRVCVRVCVVGRCVCVCVCVRSSGVMRLLLREALLDRLWRRDWEQQCR